MVSYISIAIIVLLLIISIFLISNTVSVGIAVRKEEIGIMKYIGATDAFVRAPFLLEGMVLGVVGAASSADRDFISVIMGQYPIF